MYKFRSFIGIFHSIHLHCPENYSTPVSDVPCGFFSLRQISIPVEIAGSHLHIPSFQTLNFWCTYTSWSSSNLSAYNSNVSNFFDFKYYFITVTDFNLLFSKGFIMQLCTGSLKKKIFSFLYTDIINNNFIIHEKHSMSYCCTLLYIFFNSITVFKIIFFIYILTNYNILWLLLYLIAELCYIRFGYFLCL